MTMQVPYAGGRLDRAAARRADPRWLAEVHSRPDVRVVPIWRDECVVHGTPARAIVAAGPAARRLLDATAEPVFLGLDDGAGIFAVDLSEYDSGTAVALAGGDATASVRSVYSEHTPAEAATLGYARGLLRAIRDQRHCGRCGGPTEPRHGGHVRACPACDRLLFPRIEPAVIMLVESAADPGRCLLARHRGSASGEYSTLAGFVETGESLEDAVRREVAEEVGLTVGTVAYAGSQPWPFPAGLMVAFRATAIDEVPTVDGDEILDARWFTRAELAGRAAAGRLGRVDSIDRLLLHSWLDHNG
ncbi:NUDIX hydrolase [Actinoplanes sp. SE50]|uniref:NAD(+) diphosphatase n=1 Tax=unclassified Actinoplanes TaxID=2626549 RepID=UPI00023ECCBB|nr:MULTISPECIES: NAD(+) diphosphatase [unclassified Actinoplanes]AEV84819.1 NAD+ diphosphatase [Actinoplanes sp. SE50/110]ATO83211.1 NUDIX hydrolase [Actinoplanes sp. SE50]SLM00618.1 NADH pyrophosphatase [Actinoplanes sp. SE50/110]